MAVSLKHTTQATGNPVGNGEIGKSQWNDEHRLTLAAGKLLGGNASGIAEEVTVGTGLTYSSSTLSVTGSYGTVTSVSVSGGTTGLSFSGGPVTTSGTITLAGTLAVANGGTGASTQDGAANAILPSQSTNSGKYLTTDGTNVSWATVTSGVNLGLVEMLRLGNVTL